MAQTNQIIHKVWGEVEGGETEKLGCNDCQGPCSPV